MEQSKIKNTSGVQSDISPSVFKGSFKERLKSVEARVGWSALPFPKRAQGRELCMIIAEVEMLPAGSLVRIEGNDLPCEYVAEVYSLLQHEHIEFVLDMLKETNHRIMTAKTYARTALYNAAFSLEIAIGNMVRSDMAQ